GPAGGQTLPGNATSGSGPVPRINGAIGNAGQDADIYQTRTTNPAAFSATTVGQTTLDTQLFLFDSTGRGVSFMDDVSASVFQSTLTGQFVPAAGVYYLAVTAYNFDALAGAQLIWNDLPNVGERAPTGPGAANPVTAWSGANTNTGSYGINLTGASFFADTTTTCPPNFAAATSFPVGVDATSVAVGDLNGDGKPDLAVTNFNSDSVSVLLGTGSGSFGAATSFFVGEGPSAIATGDFNTDGRPDLAVANRFTNNVSVLLGTGTGSFGASTTFGAGNNPTSVAIADFNADGKSDLAVTNENSLNVSVLLGNGAGSFGAATNFGVGFLPTSVAIGGFYAGGKPDLAAANLNRPNVSVRIDNASGGFAAAPAVPTGTPPRRLADDDVNSV
ncbi:FG-GAP-like repeat-containing protein, partial [Limnofasciculus baicalensis]